MSNLYIFTFNSLINRIVKKYDTLAGYGTPNYSLTNTNFKDGNDLQTTHVVNYEGAGDYVVITDSNSVIKSRWFIESKDTTRGNQNTLHLRRDVLADNYNFVINSPMIIERAMLIKQNPLIFNPEGFSFNQIKKQEILLKDSLGCPWIIMYMAKNATSKTITLPSQTYTADIELNTSIENSIYAAGTKYSACFDTTYRINWENDVTGDNRRHEVKFDSSTAYGTTSGVYAYGSLILKECDFNYFIQKLGATYISNYSTYDTQLTTYLNKPTISDATLALLQNASNNQLVIKDTNNNYYKVQVVVEQKNQEGSIGNTSSLFASLNSVITSSTIVVEQSANSETFGFDTNYNEITITLTNVSSIYGNQITLDPSSKFETMDSECNIIAIPYADMLVHNSFTLEDDTPIYGDLYITKESQMNIAQQFAREYTSSVVYDMQLLPYCPVQSFIEGTYLDVSGYTGDTKSYTKWQLQTGYAGVVFHLTSKQFTFDIRQSLTIPVVTGDVNIDTKISNECDIVRLCSPNYNGIFEFSVAKNDGVDLFNVDVTLKPYNPYIHINPNFKNIYGSDYNDARGLICGGDFSMPITGDQFASYELQNKNYQIAFNRQIEHMDFEYSLQKSEAVFGAAVGTIGGAVQGGIAGANAGPYGAAAGAVLGGVTSALGGALDYSYLTQRQAENRAYAIDNFKFQLGNIRALPYQLNKANPFTINNKIYPFIEVYSCTDEEKSILVDKIRWTSMTVNSIGTIYDYLKSDKTFIKGTLIRYENTNGIANNVIEAIYYELEKGVYI